MSLASTAFYQIAIMFIIIIVGMICFKIKLIDNYINKKLSDLVLLLVNPFVIFMSYQREFNATLLSGLLISLVLAVVTHLFAIILSYIVLRKKKHEADIAIERFAIIYSNCGFIGIPLVNGMLGSEGVFYLTAYMTIFNLVVWTHGMITVSGKSDRKTIINAILSPSVIATIAGFIFFVSRIMLPDMIAEALSYIGNMNTPLAMLVAGVTIAQTDLKKLIGKFRIYYIIFFKLLLIPIVMLLFFNLFDIPRLVLLTSVLAVACPTAVTINLFSIKYDKNYLYASELFAVATILSIISIPLVMIIANTFVS
ncbi:MAG: putative rane protein [Lachnospiraceae bacterium]|jgi:predicted permease|nr:putative rane protein [Lachnospiraceae bacterium]